MKTYKCFNTQRSISQSEENKCMETHRISPEGSHNHLQEADGEKMYHVVHQIHACSQ